MNIDLSLESLTSRWRRKIILSKLHLIKWDTGVEMGNEWIYASIDTQEERGKLSSWLFEKRSVIAGPVVVLSKEYDLLSLLNLPNANDIIPLMIDASDRVCVHINMAWLFEFRSENIARFGRWET
jgi:hypothetical protein